MLSFTLDTLGHLRPAYTPTPHYMTYTMDMAIDSRRFDFDLARALRRAKGQSGQVPLLFCVDLLALLFFDENKRG